MNHKKLAHFIGGVNAAYGHLDHFHTEWKADQKEQAAANPTALAPPAPAEDEEPVNGWSAPPTQATITQKLDPVLEAIVEAKLAIATLHALAKEVKPTIDSQPPRKG